MDTFVDVPGTGADDVGFMVPITCKAARTLLSLSQEELAKRADIGVMTVKNYEGGKGVGHTTWLAIKRALEQAGIQFIDENGGGPGVRLRKPLPK